MNNKSLFLSEPVWGKLILCVTSPSLSACIPAPASRRSEEGPLCVCEPLQLSQTLIATAR